MAKGKYERWLTPEGLLLLEGWARDGLTGPQIARCCGVSEKTLEQWKADHSSIRDALKKGAEIVDREVENALLKRARGYAYTEARTDYVEKDGVQEVVKVVETVKHVPPNAHAAAFWLKNRRRDRYRDRWPDNPAENGGSETGCVLLPEAGPEAGPETAEPPEAPEASEPPG